MGGGGCRGGADGGAGEKRRSVWRELPVLVVVALVIALVIKTFVVQAFFIPSSSMENTLMIGDKVLVNKLVYHFRKIQPGDVVVFDGAGRGIRCRCRRGRVRIRWCGCMT